MAFPNDILLPANAKYYAFVDTKLSYNPHWDINWSFEYALSGTEAGFCAFLANFTPLTGWPGHYLGFSGNAQLSSYLVTEAGEYILSENGERLMIESESGIGNNGMLAVGFDSTGLFALSSNTRGGVGLGSIRRDSLVIRNAYDEVIVNTQLSSLNTDFLLMSSGGFNYQKMRLRYSQAGNKLSIDFKRPQDTSYKLLTSINTRLVVPSDFDTVYTGFCFCSPVSSTTLAPSVMRLRNFHTQGNENDENYELTSFIPITASRPTTFTTLSSLTANL